MLREQEKIHVAERCTVGRGVSVRQQLRYGEKGGSAVATTRRVIADRACDSDPLRERLQKRGIELIVPYRKNRRLGRHHRRWILERINAWLRQPRKLLVRHEHLLDTDRAFFYLA